MRMLAESESGQKQRRSERTIPLVSGEEMVLISVGCHPPIIAKMLDLSEDGTLVYLNEEAQILDPGETQCSLTLYHAGKVFQVESRVARKSRRLIGFEFINFPPGVVKSLRSKIAHMSDWMRVKGHKPH